MILKRFTGHLRDLDGCDDWRHGSIEVCQANSTYMSAVEPHDAINAMIETARASYLVETTVSSVSESLALRT
jgi:hypothetical protein